MKETSLTLGAPSPLPVQPAALEALIAEQERDARSFRVFSLSHDAFPTGPDLAQRRKRQLVTDPRHGTLNFTSTLAAGARSVVRPRLQRSVSSVPVRVLTVARTRTRLCCQSCGGQDVRRERVYA